MASEVEVVEGVSAVSLAVLAQSALTQGVLVDSPVKAMSIAEGSAITKSVAGTSLIELEEA